MIIKNIFWDVDGVLANLNFAYYHFLTQHPKYAPDYKDMKWGDLPKVLPIVPKYGALELKTHPTRGVEMDKDFCSSYEFFSHRPLYPNVVETLKELHDMGYRQFTMSATFDVETKKKLLNTLLADVTDFLTIECVQHGKFMHDSAKEDMLKSCFEKYGLVRPPTQPTRWIIPARNERTDSLRKGRCPAEGNRAEAGKRGRTANPPRPARTSCSADLPQVREKSMRLTERNSTRICLRSSMSSAA